MILMFFNLLLDELYNIYVVHYAPGWILYLWLSVYICNFFDWPRSICSWMNIMILMSFCMLLDEIYIYVFQYASGWNVWYLCLSVCSWVKFMIFMFFILLLDELYDIYVCQYAPELILWYLCCCCFLYAPGWNLYMSFSMLLVEMYDIYVCQYTHALLTSDLDLSSE